MSTSQVYLYSPITQVVSLDLRNCKFTHTHTSLQSNHTFKSGSVHSLVINTAFLSQKMPNMKALNDRKRATFSQMAVINKLISKLTFFPCYLWCLPLKLRRFWNPLVSKSISNLPDFLKDEFICSFHNFQEAPWTLVSWWFQQAWLKDFIIGCKNVNILNKQKKIVYRAFNVIHIQRPPVISRFLLESSKHGHPSAPMADS